MKSRPQRKAAAFFSPHATNSCSLEMDWKHRRKKKRHVFYVLTLKQVKKKKKRKCSVAVNQQVFCSWFSLIRFKQEKVAAQHLQEHHRQTLCRDHSRNWETHVSRQDVSRVFWYKLTLSRAPRPRHTSEDVRLCPQVAATEENAAAARWRRGEERAKSPLQGPIWCGKKLQNWQAHTERRRGREKVCVRERLRHIQRKRERERGEGGSLSTSLLEAAHPCFSLEGMDETSQSGACICTHTPSTHRVFVFWEHFTRQLVLNAWGRDQLRTVYRLVPVIKKECSLTLVSMVIYLEWKSLPFLSSFQHLTFI